MQHLSLPILAMNNHKPITPTLLITGASSGIGKATAALFAERGYQVFDLSRRGTIPCDVTNEESVKSAVVEVMRRTDHIDVLILNAGFGISGPAECTPITDVRRQMEVNFTGAVTVVQHLLPHMRQRRQGRIIFTSSVAAILPIPYQSFYSASKAAINAFALALQNEVRDYGICVSVLMPGDVKTGFTAARKKVNTSTRNAQLSASYPHAEQAVAAMERDEQHGLTPQAMARCLYRIANARHPRPQYIGGAEYHIFAFLHWLLPQRLVNYIVGRLYS